jgi:type IV pilus assembly protein PilW
MVALVLGLLLSAGVITIFISAKQDYQVQDAVSQVQENGRFSLEFLANDIRMAGFSQCSNEMVTSNSVQNAPSSVTNFELGIQGFEADGASSSLPSSDFPDAEPDTDAVIIHSASNNEEFIVTQHKPASATIDVVGTHNFPQGSILMIVDSNCSSRGIFVMTGPASAGPKNKAVHNTGKTFGNPPIGNCEKKLKGNFDCSNPAAALQLAYSEGSSLFAIESMGYYIKAPAAGSSDSPTLYARSFAGPLTGGTVSEQPLVEGVSDLDILYGVRSGGNVQYKDADAVEAAGEWEEVIAVRLMLTAESLTNVDGAPVVRSFERTVRLRNRSW